MAGAAGDGAQSSGAADRDVIALEMYGRYLGAVRSGDRRRAFAAVEAAREAGLGLAEIYLDVIQPALREIGRLWQENRLTVAEEHLGTAITLSAMLRLAAELEPPPSNERLLIAACADTERHEIGLRMLCDLLDREGWDTVFLGASVPADGLVQMVREREPDVLALSASIAPHLPQLRATISAVRSAAAKQPLILVGGRPFLVQPELARTLGGDLTASDAAEAVALLRARIQ